MRPKKDTTPNVEQLVEQLSGCGFTNAEIARALGVDENTLKRNYEIYLTKGRGNLKTKLKRKQIDVASKANQQVEGSSP